MKSKKFKVSVINIGRGLLLLRKSVIAKAAYGIIKTFWREYYKVEFLHPAELYDVTLPVDAKIPFRSRALTAYMRFYFPLVAFCGYMHNERGKVVLPDIEKLLVDIATFYADAGSVFRKAQTSFKKTGSGRLIKLLRFVDKERNSAPSLHVVVAGFTYFRCMELAKEYGLRQEDAIAQELHKHAARIIDSTLLIKQHCVQDIALGLALICFRYPAFESTALELIDTLLSYPHVRVPEQVVTEVKKDTHKLFKRSIQTPGGVKGMIEYLASLPHRDKV